MNKGPWNTRKGVRDVTAGSIFVMPRIGTSSSSINILARAQNYWTAKGLKPTLESLESMVLFQNSTTRRCFKKTNDQNKRKRHEMSIWFWSCQRYQQNKHRDAFLLRWEVVSCISHSFLSSKNCCSKGTFPQLQEPKKNKDPWGRWWPPKTKGDVSPNKGTIYWTRGNTIWTNHSLFRKKNVRVFRVVSIFQEFLFLILFCWPFPRNRV